MVSVRQLAKKRLVALNDRGCRIGETHPRAKLSDHDVDLVFELRDSGMTLAAIAEKLDVTKGTVWKIITGRRRGQTAARWVSLPES